jgi:hypothetical protein
MYFIIKFNEYRIGNKFVSLQILLNYHVKTKMETRTVKQFTSPIVLFFKASRLAGTCRPDMSGGPVMQ